MSTNKHKYISGNKTKKKDLQGNKFMEWPYYKSFITPTEMTKLIDEMKALNFTYNTQPYKPLTFNRRTSVIPAKFKNQYIKFIDADYLKYDVLPLIYSEVELLKCQFSTYPPAIEYFNKHKHSLYMEFKKQHRPQTLPEYREFLFSKVKQCNNFRPTLALQTYNFLNDNKTSPQCILDFSAGWGDRLFASCVGNKKYIGLDPNTNNTHIYDTIIRNHGDHSMQKVIATGAEYFPISDLKMHMAGMDIKMFDLIFTSPPYFDYEVYSTTAQSISGYIGGKSAFEKWQTYFLFNVIMRYVPLLRNEGYIGIYIQDTDKKNYLEPIGLFTLAFAKEMGLTVCGILSSTRFPMIVLQKVGSSSVFPYTNTENRRVFSNASVIHKLFAKHYPILYAHCWRLIKLSKLGLPTAVLSSNANMDQHYKNIITRTLEKVLMQLDTDVSVVVVPDIQMEYILALKKLLKPFNIKLISDGDDMDKKTNTVYVMLNVEKTKKKTILDLDHLLKNTIDEWMLLNGDKRVVADNVHEHCISMLKKTD